MHGEPKVCLVRTTRQAIGELGDNQIEITSTFLILLNSLFSLTSLNACSHTFLLKVDSGDFIRHTCTIEYDPIQQICYKFCRYNVSNVQFLLVFNFMILFEVLVFYCLELDFSLLSVSDILATTFTYLQEY